MESLLDGGNGIEERVHSCHSTPLILASQESHLWIIEYLIFRGANLNASNRDGETPLLVTISCNRPESIALLLKSGADQMCITKAGETSLHYAAQFVDSPCLEVLYAFDLSGITDDKVIATSLIQPMKDIKGFTALQIAERRSDVTTQWKDMFRRLVHGIEDPQSMASIYFIEETEEFQDAVEQ